MIWYKLSGLRLSWLWSGSSSLTYSGIEVFHVQSEEVVPWKFSVVR
jgi:hypothetical protein